MSWRAKDHRNRFFVAQLAAYLDRLERGGPVLGKRELEHALSEERLADLAEVIAEAKAEAATARATEVKVSGHAGVYWRAAKEAFSLSAKIGPQKKTGSKAAGNRGKRAYAAQIAAEHASEEWPEVEADQHRYFNMPEEGGWGADVRSAFIVEWEIPILKRVIEMAGPELREIPRWQQYEAIESVLVAHAELEVTPASEVEIEKARSRMNALTAKLEAGR